MRSLMMPGSRGEAAEQRFLGRRVSIPTAAFSRGSCWEVRQPTTPGPLLAKPGCSPSLLYWKRHGPVTQDTEMAHRTQTHPFLPECAGASSSGLTLMSHLQNERVRWLYISMSPVLFPSSDFVEWFQVLVGLLCFPFLGTVLQSQKVCGK